MGSAVPWTHMRGENFDTVHEMIGDIYLQLDGAADELESALLYREASSC